ncbi:MAG: hypothetical protein EXR49_06965 [Dehalococcoidia bacterium]|nr:hypothetical protein [Dehalococcoidia bacterium]
MRVPAPRRLCTLSVPWAAALYALGALAEPERTQVEMHVVSCAACRAIVQREMDTIGAMAREAREAVPPVGLRARVLETAARTEQLRPEAAKLPRMTWGWPSMTLAPWGAAATFAAVAVLALAAILGILLSQRGDLSGLRGDNDRLTVLLETQQRQMQDQFGQLQTQQSLLRDQRTASDRLAAAAEDQRVQIQGQRADADKLGGCCSSNRRSSKRSGPLRIVCWH